MIKSVNFCDSLVPITVFFEGFTEKHYCPRMATMNRPVYKAINTHAW